QTPALMGAVLAPGVAGSSVNWEGNDGDQLPSYVTNPTSLPVLHCTIKTVPDRRDALRRDQLFTTPIADPSSLLPTTEGPVDFRASGIMNSSWAEVAWFIVPTGEMAGSTPLYSLYRRAGPMIAPRGGD